MAPQPKQAHADEYPISFAAVLAEELTEIRALREKRGQKSGEPVSQVEGMAARDEKSGPRADDPLLAGGDAKKTFDEAHSLDLVGLAFSGGGIRSATFNLGILQGLADRGLLPIFDYLSTVSGGGYIGSWLEAWIFRAGRQEKQAAVKHANTKKTETECQTIPGIEVVERELKPARILREGNVAVGSGAKQETHTEPLPIRFLREYSNYLTPRMGLLGADTWTLIAIYLRNLILNQIVLTLFLFALLLLPYIAVYITRTIQDLKSGCLENAAPVSVFLLLVLVLNLGARNLKGLLGDGKSREGKLGWFPQSQGRIVATIVAPLFLAAWILTEWVWTCPRCKTSGAGIWVLGGIVLLGLPCVVSYFSAPEQSPGERASFELRYPLLFWLVSALCMSSIAGLLMFAVFRQVFTRLQGLGGPLYRELAICVPLTAVVFLLAATMHMGLVGRTFFDPYREWWSRLAAWIFILTIVWTVGFAFAFFAPLGLMWLGRWLKAAGLAWVINTATGVIGAKSSKTGEASSNSWKDTALSFTPYAFIAGLVSLFALSLELTCARVTWALNGLSIPAEWGQFLGMNQEVAKVAKWVLNLTGTVASPSLTISGTAVSQNPPPVPAEFFAAHWKILDAATRDWYSVPLCLFVIGLCLFISWRVDLNEFSMNLFYRNRLVRCYLGATHHDRDPNPFTGFNSGDDFLLKDLRSKECYSGPFPIFNGTLNLVSTHDLAWQERKAESFSMTPLRCGYDTWLERVDLSHDFPKGRARQNGNELEMYAYRPADRYAYPDGGFYLGTAVSISGAALSPNMGYHSVPSLAVLMTLFNVRLGFWAGNPRDDKGWMRPGPQVGLWRLLAELFGQTDDNSKYVNLSDGGHFENLGVYELVKRRCQSIVACDAGADPAYTLEDLGNAIRKCREDIGVEIELVSEVMVPHERKCGANTGRTLTPWHCVVGKIHYEMVDRGAKPGTFVYIKASLTGDEPADVLSYQSEHSDFPHEATSDQWFTESQFESYRRLGQHIIETILANKNVAKVVKQHNDVGSKNKVTGLFEALERDLGNAEAEKAIKRAAGKSPEEF